MLDAAQIAEEENAASQEIERALGDVEAGELKLLEVAILLFLGSQVVLPILSSFAGSELWERYNRIRTRPEAEKARDALATAELKETDIDQETVIAAVVDGLLEQGVPPKDAAVVALHSYDRIRRRLRSSPTVEEKSDRNSIGTVPAKAPSGDLDPVDPAPAE